MKKTVIAMLLLSQAVLATGASAVQLFDFDGQAIVPSTPGQTAEAYAIIVNGDAVTPPLPLDQASFQYTLVVTNLTLDSAGTTSNFSGGTVAIYQDGATPADWADPTTFSDGTAILSGELVTFQHSMLTSTLGSGNGYVDWTGGTRLDELAPADQTGWPFLVLISRLPSQIQPGYTEMWDGKVEPTEDVVATEQRSWSELKAGYR